MNTASRPSLPHYRLRRRTAGFTALGATLTMLFTVAALGQGPPQAARTGAQPQVLAGSYEQTPFTLTRPYVGVLWRDSRSVGKPNRGALIRGTKLPPQGATFFSWDPVRKRSPSPQARRYATDKLIRVVLRVADEYARANPGAPRLAIGDLSKPGGGRFAGAFHASHQNGLDADIYYPRLDRRERSPWNVTDIDLKLAQDLVDRFVRAGATYVFVGPRTPLKGPRGVVMALPRHDNHMHVRLPPG